MRKAVYREIKRRTPVRAGRRTKPAAKGFGRLLAQLSLASESLAKSRTRS